MDELKEMCREWKPEVHKLWYVKFYSAAKRNDLHSRNPCFFLVALNLKKLAESPLTTAINMLDTWIQLHFSAIQELKELPTIGQWSSDWQERVWRPSHPENMAGLALRGPLAR